MSWFSNHSTCTQKVLFCGSSRITTASWITPFDLFIFTLESFLIDPRSCAFGASILKTIFFPLLNKGVFRKWTILLKMAVFMVCIRFSQWNFIGQRGEISLDRQLKTISWIGSKIFCSSIFIPEYQPFHHFRLFSEIQIYIKYSNHEWTSITKFWWYTDFLILIHFI